jgi:NTP pyrophosphatase (non-canonical NTP hydrolase)
MENQKTICDWAIRTFGYPANPQVIMDRMFQEVRELENVDYQKKDSFEKISDECADILIVLYQVADVFGLDLHSCVNHKMQINRARKWKLNNDGTAQHVKE